MRTSLDASEMDAWANLVLQRFQRLAQVNADEFEAQSIRCGKQFANAIRQLDQFGPMRGRVRIRQHKPPCAVETSGLPSRKMLSPASQ